MSTRVSKTNDSYEFIKATLFAGGYFLEEGPSFGFFGEYESDYTFLKSDRILTSENKAQRIFMTYVASKRMKKGPIFVIFERFVYFVLPGHTSRSLKKKSDQKLATWRRSGPVKRTDRSIRRNQNPFFVRS